MQNKTKPISILVLAILILGAILSPIGFAFADEQNGENDDNNSGKGNSEDEARDEEEATEDLENDVETQDDDEIAPSQVPEAVMGAALDSLPEAAGVTATDLEEAELEDGVYKLRFEKAGQKFEVEVDASTGNVLKSETDVDLEDETEDEDDKMEDLSASDIPQEVMDAALASLPASAGVTAEHLVEAELDDGVFELEFKKAGQEFEVEVDSSTFAILKTEIEDDEADEPLQVKEEKESVDIDSEDNSIKFSKDEPKLKFKVQTESSELEFEAKFKGLVEFSDDNNSTRLDKGEEAFKLDFESLNWNLTSTVSPDNSSVVITYRATTEDRDIEIEIVVPQSEGGDSVKATIIVHKWAWQDESTTNLLALISELEAKVEAEGVELPGDVLQVEGLTIAILAGELAIQFTLETEVVIGEGSPTPVVSAYTTKLKTETESEFEDGETGTEAKVKMDAVVVYPNFDNASLIHDPRIGFVDDPVQLDAIKSAIQQVTGTSLLNSAYILYAAIAITVAAVGLIALRRRISLNHAFPAGR